MLEKHMHVEQFSSNLIPSVVNANLVSTLPKTFEAELFCVSATLNQLSSVWFVDYSHLVFWFYFLTSFIINVWLIQTFFFVIRGGEAGFTIRETRGFSRAQTGDGITAVIPMCWSITMLMHASVHSSNFDENTDNTTLSLSIIAFQWGWNYFFPLDLLNKQSTNMQKHLATRECTSDQSNNYNNLYKFINCNNHVIEHNTKKSSQFSHKFKINFLEKNLYLWAVTVRTQQIFRLADSKVHHNLLQRCLIHPVQKVSNNIPNVNNRFIAGKSRNFKQYNQMYMFNTRLVLAFNNNDYTNTHFLKLHIKPDSTTQFSQYYNPYKNIRLMLRWQSLPQFNKLELVIQQNTVKSVCQLQKQKSTIAVPTILTDIPVSFLTRKWLTEVSVTRQTNTLKTKKIYENTICGLSKRARVVSTIILPSDNSLHIICGSKDVIHSWAIPGLGIKIDCIPGYNCHRRLLIKWRGLFWGQCMEVCGRYHHWMPILIKITNAELFYMWLLSFLTS